MTNIYEYLSSKMSFAASRRAQYEKREKPFEDFKKFLENLEDIPGLFVGVKFTNDKLKPAGWLQNITNKNDIIIRNTVNEEALIDSILEFDKIYKNKLSVYINSLYEIRKNEATKGNYRSIILDEIFDKKDIYKKSQLTDDQYLIIGKFEPNDPNLKTLKKWGFEEAFINNDIALPFKVNYTSDHYWYFKENSEYSEKNSLNLDDDKNPIVYLVISFKTLCENLKYINKEFFDVVEDEVQESKISKLIK